MLADIVEGLVVADVEKEREGEGGGQGVVGAKVGVLRSEDS